MQDIILTIFLLGLGSQCPARPVRAEHASEVQEKLVVLREFQEFREFRSEGCVQRPGPQAAVH